MDIYGIIYKITNLVNGKVYIGQTIRSIEERKRQHLLDADNGCEFILHKAIRKYKKESFNWTIIDSSYSREELNDKEVFWIVFYNSYSKEKQSNGYNMTKGGESLSGNDNPFYGKTHSDEAKKKMSEKAKGRVVSERTRRLIGDTHSRKYSGKKSHKYGVKLSKCIREKMSKAHTGVKKTETHKMNISLSKKGKETISTKAVIQLSLKGDYIAQYSTIKEGEEKTGTYSTHIVNCCKGNMKSSNGYMWMYKEDYSEDNIMKKVKEYENGTTTKKEIIQLTLEGEFVEEYKSISDGAKSVNGDRSSIAKCCKDNSKTCKGFRWMYKYDYEKSCQ